MIYAGVVEDYPEATGCFMQMPNCSKPGIEVELFDNVMSGLQLQYQLVRANSYGGFNKQKGVWTGLLGLITRGEVNVSAVTVRLTQERLKFMNFSFPIGYFHQIFKFAPPKDKEYESFISRPFDVSVWVALFVCLGLSGVVFLLASYLFVSGSRMTSAFVFMWRIYAVVLGQSYKRTFKKTQLISIDLLGATWLLASFLSVTVYATYMQSLIMVSPSPKIPFKSVTELADLIQNSGWRMITDSKPLSNPRCSTEAACALLKSALQERPMELHETGLYDQLNDGKSTLYTEEDVYRLVDTVTIDSSDNTIVLKDEQVTSEAVGFVFPLNSQLKRRFDEELIRHVDLVMGLKRRYMERLWPLEDAQTSAPLPLTMQHLHVVFVVLTTGSTCAIALFLLQLALYYICSV